MKNKAWIAWIKENQACIDGFREAKDLAPQEWYDKTERGDWIIWVLRKLGDKEKNFWVEVANFCAKKAKGYATYAAATYAAAAASATYATYAAAAFAADAAATYAAAAASATYAAAAAAYAADAADAAAAAASATYAAAAARGIFRKELAEYIRRISPILGFKEVRK